MSFGTPSVFLRRNGGGSLYGLWVKVLLGGALVNRETALATMNRVTGRGLRDHVGWRGGPLLHMSGAVLPLHVFDGADRLTGKQRLKLAGLLCRRLNVS